MISCYLVQDRRGLKISDLTENERLQNLSTTMSPVSAGAGVIVQVDPKPFYCFQSQNLPMSNIAGSGL